MEIKILKPTDVDYPLVMELVPFAEKYELMKIDNLVVVPLFQVIDAISEVKPDVVIHNSVECCPTCGKPVTEQNIVKPYFDKLKAKMFDLPKADNKTYWDAVDDIGDFIDNLLTEQGDNKHENN